MPFFSYTSEIVINSPAQKIFAIVSNPANHAELAGNQCHNRKEKTGGEILHRLFIAL